MIEMQIPSTNWPIWQLSSSYHVTLPPLPAPLQKNRIVARRALTKVFNRISTLMLRDFVNEKMHPYKTGVCANDVTCHRVDSEKYVKNIRRPDDDIYLSSGLSEITKCRKFHPLALIFQVIFLYNHSQIKKRLFRIPNTETE
jgi:hypothetical protein